MKVWIVKYELWPYHDIYEKNDSWAEVVLDIPEDVVWRYNVAQREFLRCREELEGLIEYASSHSS